LRLKQDKAENTLRRNGPGQLTFLTDRGFASANQKSDYWVANGST